MTPTQKTPPVKSRGAKPAKEKAARQPAAQTTSGPATGGPAPLPWKDRLAQMFPFDWEIVKYAGAEPVPNHIKRWWFALGGTAAYLLIIQVVTGILLTFYYVPTPEEAYQSVAAITHEVRFGWFIRSLHKWSANFMIVAVMLHLLRVYMTGAYRHPRQLNWMVGVLLLFTTLGFGFTGYSLVYEQLSFWGATVAANLVGATPLVGEWLATLLRGGSEVGANTLTRFFMFHIGVLPTAIFALVALHVLLIRLHGVSELRFEDEPKAQAKKTFPFFPDHVTTELLVGVFLMYVLTLMALIFPAGLGQPADPTVTPSHIKPEWYFYANFRLLKLTSLNISVALTGVMGAIFFFWPFVEEKLVRRYNMPEKFSIYLGMLTFLGFLVLTVWEALGH